MNKELKKLLTEAKKSGWTVTQEDGNVYDFGWWSPAGQDFHIQVDTENDVGYFLHNLYSVYNDFDVSVETYLWLDDTGHGRNGAPYDMKDVYEDMEKQPNQGENIQKSKREIEESLDTINQALEKLFDEMFQNVAMDISSDIQVLEVMLKQDGLTEDELHADKTEPMLKF